MKKQAFPRPWCLDPHLGGCFYPIFWSFHFQVFQLSGPERLNYFRPKKPLFARPLDPLSSAQNSLFFFLFEFASEQAFLVSRKISGLFGWDGVLSLHWKPLGCKIFSVCGRKFDFSEFRDAKLLLPFCIFRFRRVLVRSRSCIFFDFSCCWSYTVLQLLIKWVNPQFFVKLSLSWFLLC